MQMRRHLTPLLVIAFSRLKTWALDPGFRFNYVTYNLTNTKLNPAERHKTTIVKFNQTPYTIYIKVLLKGLLLTCACRCSNCAIA